MLKKLIVSLLVFCCSLPAFAQVTAIDNIVEHEMQRQHITGLSLAVVKDGKVLVSKGYGFANVNDSIPATDKTIYRLASLSKEIIAVNVLILAEQGKLSLSDPVTKYITDAPRAWRNITIRNLLNHTSGLERESPAFNWRKRQPDAVVIQATFNDKLLFPPGTGWSYSNVGYFIIADIIRKVSGVSFEDYMNAFFFRCHLPNTTTTSASIGLAQTKGYAYDEGRGKVWETKELITFRASSAVASCITDLIRWDSMIGQSNILTKQDWSKIWEDTVREKERPDGSVSWYGYGWGVNTYHGHRLLTHSGSNPGFENEYWKFIDDKTSIIILTNADKCAPGRIAKRIYAAVAY